MFDYTASQQTLAPPYHPYSHFESPYYEYPWKHDAYYGWNPNEWGYWDLSTKNNPILAQEQNVTVPSQENNTSKEESIVAPPEFFEQTNELNGKTDG